MYDIGECSPSFFSIYFPNFNIPIRIEHALLIHTEPHFKRSKLSIMMIFFKSVMVNFLMKRKEVSIDFMVFTAYRNILTLTKIWIFFPLWKRIQILPQQLHKQNNVCSVQHQREKYSICTSLLHFNSVAMERIRYNFSLLLSAEREG